MHLVHNANFFVVDAFLTSVRCFKYGSLESLEPFLEAMSIYMLFECLQNQNTSSLFKSEANDT